MTRLQLAEGVARMAWAWRRALLSTALLATPELVHAIECKIACRGSENCSFTTSDDKPVKMNGDRYTRHPACERLKATGLALIRYRHKDAWFTAPGTGATNSSGTSSSPGAVKIADVFLRYPPDRCSVPSAECHQKAMDGMSGEIGGSPIDGRKSAPGGQGQPCALGFPCGRVLPPASPWKFRLASDAFSGTWVVRLARGKPATGQSAQTTARIDHGMVAADASWFAPGRLCAYDVVDANGSVVASGEFTVAGRSTQSDLVAMAATRAKAEGLPDAIAWVDSLIANRFDWDAERATLDPDNTGERK